MSEVSANAANTYRSKNGGLQEPPMLETDGSLLRKFARQGSQEAFATLTRRYAGFVYAACLRETGSPTLAEDAAQGVFLLLSLKARVLQKRSSIAGWLYTAARYVARNLSRQEKRRQMAEQRAFEETADHSSPSENALWERMEPHVYDALNRLKAADREAVLLRFVQGQSFSEVGQSMGIAENTARMRTNRALEKIRAHLGKMGLTVTAAALASLMQARSAQAAPASVLAKLLQVPDLTIGAANAPLATALRQTQRQLARGAARMPLLGLGFGFATLFGLWMVSQQRLQPATVREQRQLFAALAGTWSGTLEFADDKTRQPFTYPTTVSVLLTPQNNTLQLEASFGGSSAIDVTTLRADNAGNSLRIQNGGPQSSHQLDATGRLFRRANGEFLFDGLRRDGVTQTEILLQLRGRQFMLQESYKRGAEPAFQFRNRYTLTRR